MPSTRPPGPPPRELGRCVAAARAMTGRSCPRPAWGYAPRGVLSRCQGSDRGGGCRMWSRSALARAGRLSVGQSLHGAFENAPEPRPCRRPEVDRVALVRQPVPVIVGLLVWARASKRIPRWTSLSTSSAALRSPRIYTAVGDITAGRPRRHPKRAGLRYPIQNSRARLQAAERGMRADVKLDLGRASSPVSGRVKLDRSPRVLVEGVPRVKPFCRRCGYVHRNT
jgi:hypothetical protein